MLAFLLVVCYHIGVKKTVKFDKFTVLFLTKSFGGLAQLVRASASHAEGQRFESAALHCVAADCISFAATFYAMHKKSLLIHSVAAPFQTEPAAPGFGLGNKNPNIFPSKGKRSDLFYL